MVSQPKKLDNPEDIEEFINKYDTFLFDCDGVIWEGNRVFPGVHEALDLLRNRGKRLLYVTNNSTISRSDYAKKFSKLGLQATTDEIFTSAFAVATYLSRVLHFPETKKVYIIGQSGIADELAEEGIRSFGGAEDNEEMEEDGFSKIKIDPEVGAVVCGLDLHINYKKLAKAFTFLRNGGKDVLFLLTNDDKTFPTHGTVFPGAGAISAPLISSLNRQPDAILGKPNKSMLEAIIAKYELDPTKMVMIGDRLDTDVAFGVGGGIDTCAVLTGVSNEDEILAGIDGVSPTVYLESIGKFVGK